MIDHDHLAAGRAELIEQVTPDPEGAVVRELAGEVEHDAERLVGERGEVHEAGDGITGFGHRRPIGDEAVLHAAAERPHLQRSAELHGGLTDEAQGVVFVESDDGDTGVTVADQALETFFIVHDRSLPG